MLSDFRFAFRQLAKSPGFTVVALLTLGLGLGVNTAMFTVANTILLQQLPFRQPDELVRIFRTAPQANNWPHSAGSFHDLRAGSHTFSGLAALRGGSFNYAAPGQPAERLRGMSVTTDFFPLLGTSAALGRTFLPEETKPGGQAVAVISHECWQSRFASDPAIVGRQIRLDGNPATIVGVMPASFVPRLLWGQVEIWRPLPFTAAEEQNRENNYLVMIGRIAPGFTLEQAEADLRTIAARIATEHPETNAGGSVRLVPLSRSGQDDATRHASWFLLGLAGFVLLIACVNLSNLQFSRAAGRAREQAIRVALGASRWRIIHTLCAESILLGVGGGLLGLLIAIWCNDLLGRQLVMGPVAGVDLPLDHRVFIFSLGLAALSAGASGLLPAWFATRSSVNDTLKLGGRGTVGRSHHRVRHGLVIAEVALALVLLAGASLFIRGLQRFTDIDPGWNPDNLLTASLSLPTSRYSDEPARRAFFVKLDEALAASPLIERSALLSSVPVREYSSSTSYQVEGRTPTRHGEELLANLTFVSPGFLDTVGLRLKQGRFFNDEDRAGKPPVIVINETMAKLFFPGENPIGRRIGDPDPTDPSWWEIIGVVSDAGFPAELNQPNTRMQTYRPVAQDSFNFTNIAVRGRVPVDQLTAELRRIVTAIDPDQPVYGVITARGDIDRSLANFNLIGRLLGGFALLGLLLASIGLYGVLTNYVQQRTPELGVRLALGAQLGDILRLVLAEGLRLALVGTAIGLAGAVALGRMLTELLPALGALDPLTLSVVVAGLLAVAFLACWLPARRATRVDPMVTLRAE
jgi:putative ABC transport system permease protein